MIKPINLFSPQAVNNQIDCLSPIKRVLENYWYILGKEVTSFEKEFSDYLSVQDCVSVANGTDALEIALRALGVTRSDVIITTANAGFYSSTALHALEAIPYYIDVDFHTLTMSVEELKKALTKIQPKAIIVTHLYGQLANIEEICRIASDANIPVIEDCAQAHGARRDGKFAGSFGQIGCFSFYPTKNLGALGDGGGVVSNDSSLCAKMRQIRQYGWGIKYHVEQAGGCNSRLDELQAAILREKLPHLESWNRQRRQIACTYNAAFAGLPLIIPNFSGEDYVGHLYVIRLAGREAFRKYLQDLGITTDIHYPIPDHFQSAYYSQIPANAIKLPVTEDACHQVVSLPCYPGLTQQEIDYVIQTVNQYFNELENKNANISYPNLPERSLPI